MFLKRSPSSGRPDLFLRRRIFSVPTLVSFVVAGAVLALLVTRLDVDLATTWSNIRTSNPVLFLLAIAVHYMTFLFRGARWRVLLRNAAKESPDQGVVVPSAFRCGGLVLLGWFVNSISWFRLGDAYRAYGYTQDTGASFAHTAGTILAERVVDMVTVFCLLLVAAFLMVVWNNMTPPPGVLWAGFGMVVTGGVVLLTMRLFRGRMAHVLPAYLQGAYHRLHMGTMGSLRQIPLVMLLGLAAWMCEFGRFYLVLQALGLPLNVGLVLFTTLVGALLTTIPLTPGGLGVVETGVTGVLTIFLPREAAISAAILDRSISYISIIILGGILFVVRQLVLTRRRLAPSQSAVEKPGVP